MFNAYRKMREYSHQSRLKCIRFQLWTWQFNLKHWPRNWWLNRKIKNLIKKDPDRMAKVFEEIKQKFNED